MDYKASGVDIDAGNETVRRIRGLARSTFTPGVLSEIGSFGGLFKLEPGNPDLNFATGLAAVGLQKYSHAVMAFERVVALQPDNDRARLEQPALRRGAHP